MAGIFIQDYDFTIWQQFWIVGSAAFIADARSSGQSVERSIGRKVRLLAGQMMTIKPVLKPGPLPPALPTGGAYVTEAAASPNPMT